MPLLPVRAAAAPCPSQPRAQARCAKMQLCVRRLSALLLLLACPSSLVTAKRTKHLRSPSQTSAVPPRDLQEAPECFRTLDWTSEKGELLVNGHPFHLKGTTPHHTSTMHNTHH
jgi:hypothetical protein